MQGHHRPLLLRRHIAEKFQGIFIAKVAKTVILPLREVQLPLPLDLLVNPLRQRIIFQRAHLFPVLENQAVIPLLIGTRLRQGKIQAAKLHVLRLRRNKEGRQHHQAGAKQGFAPLETVIVFPSYFHKNTSFSKYNLS